MLFGGDIILAHPPRQGDQIFQRSIGGDGLLKFRRFGIGFGKKAGFKKVI